MNTTFSVSVYLYSCFRFTSDCLLTNPAPTGYTVTGSTTVGATPTVTCASEYSGTPASPTCQADGSWDVSFNGCDRGESQGFEALFYTFTNEESFLLDIYIF